MFFFFAASFFLYSFHPWLHILLFILSLAIILVLYFFNSFLLLRLLLFISSLAIILLFYSFLVFRFFCFFLFFYHILSVAWHFSFFFCYCFLLLPFFCCLSAFFLLFFLLLFIDFSSLSLSLSQGLHLHCTDGASFTLHSFTRKRSKNE